MTHNEMMHMPGYDEGLFYYFIIIAHVAGERPTAAFPSSHVGLTFVLLLLASAGSIVLPGRKEEE